MTVGQVHYRERSAYLLAMAAYCIVASFAAAVRYLAQSMQALAKRILGTKSEIERTTLYSGTPRQLKKELNLNAYSRMNVLPLPCSWLSTTESGDRK